MNLIIHISNTSALGITLTRAFNVIEALAKTLEGINITEALLPPWASNSPILFNKKYKKALGSQYASKQINNYKIYSY